MSDIFCIGLFVLIIMILVGTVLGLYLASYATKIDEDEDYDSGSTYFDDKWKQQAQFRKDDK